MGYSGPSFLDTKEEHDEWHHGVYRGLKILNPQKLYEEMKFNGKGWREWYRDDNHYHDFAMYVSYGVKGAAVVAGIYGLKAVGIL